ncbi:plasmid SOS inhibition protein A, partial [Escherichia coli]|nr:plasmid SOS inhibition protein A [Escherichia coli]
AEASLAAKEAGHAVREMERWMVPNKLREVRDAATITRIARKQPE